MTKFAFYTVFVKIYKQSSIQYAINQRKANNYVYIAVFGTVFSFLKGFGFGSILSRTAYKERRKRIL